MNIAGTTRTWQGFLALIIAGLLVVSSLVPAVAAELPEDEDLALDRTDAMVMAIFDMYTILPYGNVISEDLHEFDFIPLYDDVGQVVARCVKYPNGSYVVINNNKSNPFILEHGLHGYALIEDLSFNNPGMSLVYDGPGKIRVRDFEDTDCDCQVPDDNYHTAYPDADEPDSEWGDLLIKLREEMFDIDGNLSEEWLQEMQVTFFVRRQYVLSLDRLPDQKGLTEWTAALRNGAKASKVIKGFFHSPEYTVRPFMESLYVMQLYMTFLNRTGEPLGVEKWSTAMLYGATKDQVFRGFAKSEEFAMYCEQNDLIP